ncbi:dCTP deaminase, dUMP-forming [Candidatus Burarchaeum australiense]|nr:dCTP deaminase, dUMP-forming [Candidatus Burarchaeum australiense]
MSDAEILEAMEKGELRIEPFERKNLGPDSIDIRMGRELLLAKNVGKTLDPLKKGEASCFEKVTLKEGEPFMLGHHQFVLANTVERLGLGPSIAAQIEGRSSIGRFGIVIHMTAGIIHAGFGSKAPSTLTLEVYSVNPNPVLLHPGMKIAQLSFFRLGRKAREGYDSRKGSKYVGQRAPEPPKAYLD